MVCHVIRCRYACVKLQMKALKKIKIFSTSPLKIAEKNQMACILYSQRHASGEVPSAGARSEPGPSTPSESKSENVVIFFPHPCELLSRSTGVSSRLSPGRGRRTHTFLSCEKSLGFFLFLEAVRQASPAEESSKLDPVYFTLRKK